MKSYLALVLVLCTVVLGNGVTAPCWADSLISFTDTNNTSYLIGNITNENSIYRARYASWTQTVATTDTSIGAIVGYDSSGKQLTAWLTNAVGPGATTANVIASATVTVPTGIGVGQDLSLAPMTAFFSGLSLVPDTYYLVLWPETAGTNVYWYGDVSGVTRTTAPGFTIERYGFYFSDTPVSFPPSSDSWSDTAVADSYFFSVDGKVAPVPEPATMLLLASGLVGLAGMRRKLLKR